MSLRILGVTLVSNLMFETHCVNLYRRHFRVFVWYRARAGKLFDYLCVLKNFFNAYVLSSLEYFVPVWMSSAESHLCLLDRVVCSSERLCEGDFVALCLLYEMHHAQRGLSYA